VAASINSSGPASPVGPQEQSAVREKPQGGPCLLEARIGELDVLSRQ